MFVKPLLSAYVLRKDPLDRTIGLIPRAAKGGHTALSRSETGQLRWYAASMAAGAVLVIGAIVAVAVRYELCELAKGNEPVMILPWLILIPFIGGLLCWMGERFGATLPRWIALLTMSLELALGLWLWAHGDYSFAPAPGVDPTFALEFKRRVDPAFRHQRAPGPRRPVAVDDPADRPAGHPLGTLLLEEIQRHVGFFHLNLMWILGGVVGVFLALDLFMFFFFWEMMLVPMYFLIALWGHSSSDGKKTRIYAATKFFIFTQASGLIMLVAILGLVLVNFNSAGVIAFNYADLLKTEMSLTTEYILMLGFFIAFAVKLPVVPFGILAA